MSLLNFIIQHAAKFCGSVAANYHLSVDDANQQARNQAQIAAYQNAARNLIGDYYSLSDILAAAINRTVDYTSLLQVKDVSQLLVSPWLAKDENSDWFFWYRTYKRPYTDVMEHTVRIMLEQEMNRILSLHCPLRVKVGIKFEPYGSVVIAVKEVMH